MSGFLTEKLDDPVLGAPAYVLRYLDVAECAAEAKARHEEVNGTRRETWENGSAWKGHESKADAVRYAISGNEALVAVAEQYMEQIEAAGIETVRAHWDPSVCGAYPIVPEYLAGRPACMRRRMESSEERHPVRVYADTTSSAMIGAEPLKKRGAAILAFVMALAQERPVELWQGAALDQKRGIGYAGMFVRCPTAPLNVGVCAHILTSQAWTRGIGYDYAHSRGSSGGWAYSVAPSSDMTSRYMTLNRATLDMTPEDVFIPGIYSDDPLIKDPVGWINRELRRIRNTEHDM